eukprot:TRINITY_DN64758_c0_g3_i1.p1 TRINITY_DN64758_c0_g3~~TRINITY_DN64758_c0_g3_i1.p1  ORF type:complete len:310 (+),score=78.45 TRINITY_DN64758_c0_g3_i1:65-931(+)
MLRAAIYVSFVASEVLAEVPTDAKAGSSEGMIGGLSQQVESSLGVGGGTAQFLTWLAVILVLYMAFQLVVAATSGGLKKSRKLGNKVLLFGQNNSGKTALFFKMRDPQEQVNTVSSLLPNSDTLRLSPSPDVEPMAPVEVVDYPGHRRMRGKAFDIVPDGRCIIYMIDSEDKPKMKDAAENLYELMTNRDLCELHTPILLALNKIDSVSARTQKFIIDEIEREIETMRHSRSVALEGEDQVDSYLGVEGEKFKLLEHAPCPFEVCRVSVKKNELEPIYEFIRAQFQQP